MKNITDLIQVKNNQLVTTSNDVAKVFGKRHEQVLRKVKDLDCSQNFTKHNFVLSKYTDLSGRELLSYNITRDGLVFLIMGFTGKKASEFKEAYINAFNSMEQHILDTQSKEQARQLKNEKLRAGAFKSERDSLKEVQLYHEQEISEVKSYYDNQIEKWRYECNSLIQKVNKQPKRQVSSHIPNLQATRKVKEFNFSYLTSKDTNLDSFFRSMRDLHPTLDLTPLTMDWVASKILLRVLKGDIQKMFGVANQVMYLEENMTKTIYDHELVGLC